MSGSCRGFYMVNVHQTQTKNGDYDATQFKSYVWDSTAALSICSGKNGVNSIACDISEFKIYNECLNPAYFLSGYMGNLLLSF